MIQRIGENTLSLETAALCCWAAVGGKKEAEGPLGSCFDQTFSDNSLGQESWEKAEAMLQKKALELALGKSGLPSGGIDFLLAGDLLNQCISSTFGLRSFGIPFLGQYGACSTMALTLGLSSVLVESGAARRAAAITSSHFCSAERQFRLPLEYGGQRAPTAQWTATASGCVIVGTQGPISVRHVTFGKITDLGITDAANMGAAMAPAAAETLLSFFRDTATLPEQYDAIYTGDLGLVGSRLLCQLMEENGQPLTDRYRDCGLLLFDREKQDVHAGGSGCGCSAAVLCSHILPMMARGELKNVLFAATGALMSPTSTQQGESIPGISHLVHLVSGS